MSMTVDAIVVGAGAGGGVVASELASSGLRVVLFDRGKTFKTEEFGHDELLDSQWDWGGYGLRFGPEPSEVRTYRSSLNTAPRRMTPADSQFSALPWCVGGGTLNYQALSWRFHPGTFKLKTLYGVPPDSALEDYPLSYEDLEPYYEKAEYELGVSGEPGPNGPPRRKPYPMPPLPDNREAEVLFPAARRLGWKPYHPPLAILSEPYRGRMGCIRCSFCHGYGCEVDAKSSTAVTMIPAALKTGLCELYSETYVREVTVDAEGTPNGVTFLNASGKWQQLQAKIIVLACSATETPRLLLNSKSRRHPNGIGNTHDQVGRYLHSDIFGGVDGYFDTVVGDSLGPGPSCALDFQFEHTPVPPGGQIYFNSSRLPLRVANSLSRPPGLKSWGKEYKDFLRRYFWKYIHANYYVHGIPWAGSRVDLDPKVRDAHGIPVCRLTFRKHRWSAPQQQWLGGQVEKILKEAGAKFTVRRPAVFEESGSVGVHQLGTCRMGNDPRNSVADRTGRLHDLPNVFIADGSLMTNAGGANPCLTIQALAFWVSDHIVKSWKGGGLRD